jgi:hypothetical protein
MVSGFKQSRQLMKKVFMVGNAHKAHLWLTASSAAWLMTSQKVINAPRTGRPDQ